MRSERWTTQLSKNAGAMALILPLLMGSPSAAQNPPVPERIDPKACSERLPPNSGTQGQGPSESLSEKLARSEGVICPPLGVDPEIVEPPPAGGRTPVIPPPGSPGGDPTVRPK